MKRLLVLALLLVGALLGCSGNEADSGNGESAAAAPSATLPPRIQIAVSEALVFSHPSREAEVLFRLIEGDTLTILAQTEPDALGGRWFQVAQGETFGWVAETQTELLGDLSAVRVVPLNITPANLPTAELPLTPTPILEDGIGAVVTAAEVPIFSRPGEDAAPLMTLQQNETAEVLGRTNPDANGLVYYFLAREAQALGWAAGDALTIQGNLEFVPIVVDAFEGAFSPELAQAGTPTLTAAPQTETASPDITPTLAAEITATPFFTLTPTPTLSLVETAQAASSATPFIDATGNAAAPAPEATPTSAGVQEGVPPPLTITLPEGWTESHVLVPIESTTISGVLAITRYQGALGEGVTGTIFLIWGFPNISPNLDRYFTEGTGDIDLFVDGVQLLRSVVEDPTQCTIGLDTQRQYRIGGRDAVGSIFAASPCLDGRDHAGFFAVLQVGGGNFAFFASVEPASAVGDGLRQIQAILDTVQFDPSLEATE